MNDESSTHKNSNNDVNNDAKSEHDENSDNQYTKELISAPKEKKAERIDTRALKDDAAKREKKQPLITRIVKAIKAEKKS
ncbi:MAG TPA: hypothetical protein DEA90_10770, partial [Opitutae bacterium]|nr:hypothetical protein [Opitutae bacterium]